ncbi:helix-turn-helix transcriptional regulator [uncultured Psychroserpens sp.]|uniref:helix-turn-helix transcriptional regulator n=1 Tax=uncultured Psychroserpens sp. TaxID=255436 RepID=UPI00261BBA80|nr:helix-turn-helix transcriptional regulator [uncultured Psychroserpens sp.]
MTFNRTIFNELNSKDNAIIKSNVKQFEGQLEASGLSIKVPINGVENYTINHINYKVKPGEFLLVNKGEQISCHLDSKTSVESMCIYLNYDVYQSIIDTLSNSYTLDHQDNGNSKHLLSDKYYLENCDLSNMIKQLAQCKNLYDLTEEDYITISERLAKHQMQQFQMVNSLGALHTNTKIELLKRLRTAKAFINDNYYKNIMLSDISEASYLSKYHLLRSFKDVYKTTPYKALQNRRIEKAKMLLALGESIQDTALKCGFNDRRSFSRVFKKSEGITPLKFQYHSS